VTDVVYEECEPLWDCNECGAYLNLRGEYVEKQARAGVIPGFKIGKYWRFDPAVIREFVKNGGTR
jgi:hypothetical protein